jgi:hypothetical protein
VNEIKERPLRFEYYVAVWMYRNRDTMQKNAIGLGLSDAETSTPAREDYVTEIESGQAGRKLPQVLLVPQRRDR